MTKICQTVSCHLPSQQTEQNQGNGYKDQGFDNVSNAKAHKYPFKPHHRESHHFCSDEQNTKESVLPEHTYDLLNTDVNLSVLFGLEAIANTYSN